MSSFHPLKDKLSFIKSNQSGLRHQWVPCGQTAEDGESTVQILTEVARQHVAHLYISTDMVCVYDK